MRSLGFNGTIPDNWNRWWLAMWAVTAPALIVSAFHLRFWMWVLAAIFGFLAPEMISLLRKTDDFPPLTHTIRHFLPNWVAFPLIYFSLGSVGANWFDFSQPLRVGALMGLLGCFTGSHHAQRREHRSIPGLSDTRQIGHIQPRPNWRVYKKVNERYYFALVAAIFAMVWMFSDLRSAMTVLLTILLGRLLTEIDRWRSGGGDLRQKFVRARRGFD